ncbi:hypothetical protein Tco_1555977 [Tanacetum coccineum]
MKTLILVPKHLNLGETKVDQITLNTNHDNVESSTSTKLYSIVEDAHRHEARHFVSSSSSHHQGMSSHQHDDDDDDDNVQTSRASTPSPTTYLNSLDPLNYQMPSTSEQTDETLFERQTVLLNQT